MLVSISSQNLENLSLAFYWQKYMMTNIYLIYKILIGLRSIRKVSGRFKVGLSFYCENSREWGHRIVLRHCLLRNSSNINKADFSWQSGYEKNMHLKVLPKILTRGKEVNCRAWHSWRRWKWSWFPPKHSYMWWNMDCP